GHTAGCGHHRDHGVIQKIPLSPGSAGQSGTKLVFVPGCQQTSHAITVSARQWKTPGVSSQM
ncbi:hypothetical protein, partial [Escherichia coli]|uniref:hypothetical protein n=1 Tax=Escherichia coli TaxID=562 RepID=UPI001BDBEBE7